MPRRYHFFIALLRYGVFTLFWAIPTAISAQNLATYRLTCDPDSFAVLYAQPNEEIYITATLTYQGLTWDDVQMRIRGDGSRRRPKKSLKLKSEIPFFNGRRTLNFNADYLDPSYLHSVLASRIMKEAGHPTFHAEHAQLFLNGEVLGLYILVENMDEDFLSARDFDPEGNLYKATLDDASMSIFDDVDFHWEKKTGTGGRGDLRDLIGQINTIPDAGYQDWVRDTFDYPLMINMLALNMLIANGSTYYHNYYLYHDLQASGQWIMFPWDLDFTFSSFGVNFPYHRSSGIANPDNPFLERAILNPAIRNDVSQRLSALSDTIFNLDYLSPIIDSLATTISTAVASDETDDVPDRATWRSQVDKVKQFIQNRPAKLFQQLADHPLPFQVDRRVAQDDNNLTFRWSASSDPQGNPISYTLFLSTSPWFSDDETTTYSGLLDTTLTRSKPATGTYYWLVSATDGQHTIEGFDTRNRVNVTSEGPQPLYITEINYHASPTMDTGDWVEVHNPNGVAVDLTDWVLQDGVVYHRFSLDQGGELAPGGFLIVSRDTVAFRSFFPNVTPLVGEPDFGWSSLGDAVRLVTPLGEIFDEVLYLPGLPWPIEANGGGSTLERIRLNQPGSDPRNWQASFEPGGTPGQAGNTAISIEEGTHTRTTQLHPNYPNPFSSQTHLVFQLEKPGRVRLELFDTLGRRVTTIISDRWYGVGIHTVPFETSALGTGLYFLNLLVDSKTVQRRPMLPIIRVRQ